MKLSVSAARKNAKINQRQAANFFGISTYRLSRYETGKDAVPYDILSQMCGLYGCSLDDLYLPFVKEGAWNCESIAESGAD